MENFLSFSGIVTEVPKRDLFGSKTIFCSNENRKKKKQSTLGKTSFFQKLKSEKGHIVEKSQKGPLSITRLRIKNLSPERDANRRTVIPDFFSMIFLIVASDACQLMIVVYEKCGTSCSLNFRKNLMGFTFSLLNNPRLQVVVMSDILNASKRTKGRIKVQQLRWIFCILVHEI